MVELPTPLGSSVVAAGLSLLLVVLFYAFQPADERRAVMPVAVLSFLVKAALVPAVFFYLKNEGYLGFTYLDGFKYHDAAFLMSVDLKLDLPRMSYGWDFRDPGYNYIGSLLYLFFGPNTLVPRFFNAAFSCITLLYVFRIGKLTFDDRVARVAVLLLAFLPFTLLIIVDQRKDAVVQLLATVLLYHTIRILDLDRRWASSLAWGIVALVAMYYMRSGFILPFLGIVGICFVMGHRSVVEGLSLAAAFLVVFMGLQLALPSESPLSIGSNVERFQGKVQESSELAEVGGLARFSRVRSLGEIWKLPLASALILLLPFPPRFGGRYLPSTILSWANLPTLFFFPHMVRGIYLSFRDDGWKRRLPLVLFPLVFTILLGMTSVGIARYRETFLPALLILAAAGVRHGVDLVTRLVIYGGLVGLAAVVYFTRLT